MLAGITIDTRPFRNQLAHDLVLPVKRLLPTFQLISLKPTQAGLKVVWRRQPLAARELRVDILWLQLLFCHGACRVSARE